MIENYPKAWARAIDWWVDLNWDEKAVCQWRDCNQPAHWVIGPKNNKSHDGLLACTLHTGRFCARKKLPVPWVRAATLPEAQQKILDGND